MPMASKPGAPRPTNFVGDHHGRSGNLTDRIVKEPDGFSPDVDPLINLRGPKRAYSFRHLPAKTATVSE